MTRPGESGYLWCAPGSRGSSYLVLGHGLGGLVEQFELRSDCASRGRNDAVVGCGSEGDLTGIQPSVGAVGVSMR